MADPGRATSNRVIDALLRFRCWQRGHNPDHIIGLRCLRCGRTLWGPNRD